MKEGREPADDDDSVWLRSSKNVSMSTALRWAKKLGLAWRKRQKSYYVDSHDREDVLHYRNVLYLPREHELEVR